MNVILVGPDRGLGDALESAGVAVSRIDGAGTGSALRDAGIAEADLLVVTDVGEATAIPIAREGNPGIRVVIYASDTMPEFVRGQVDLAVDPDLLGPEVVASAIAGDGATSPESGA
jgi:Trk K+ transport system NAD-binding subunit